MKSRNATYRAIAGLRDIAAPSSVAPLPAHASTARADLSSDKERLFGRTGEGALIKQNARVVHEVPLPARPLKKCCKNPNLPAALVAGFCALKFCEDPELLKKRRRRRRRENVERVRI